MGDSARAALDRAMSEAAWQRQVTEYAERRGWTVWHDHDARRNASGLPDLILIRERVVWAELKRVGGRPTAVQEWFHAVLANAGQEVHVWTPDDWERVRETLA